MGIDRKQRLLDAGIGAKVVKQLFPSAQSKNGQILVKCLWHEDKTPSLSVNTDSGLCNCFACGAKGNVFDLYDKAQGISSFTKTLDALEQIAGIKNNKSLPGQNYPKVVATYYYHDEAGSIAYCKKRYEPGFQPGRSKSFAFYHTDSSGKEIKGRGGDAVLFNCHRLVGADPIELIFVVEGEAKADALTEWDLLATTLDSGGQSGKGSSWRDDFEKYFADREVVIIPDNDKTGKIYADTFSNHIISVAASVKILNLPGLGPKGDILNWIKSELDEAGLKNSLKNRSGLKEKFLSFLPYADPVTAIVNRKNKTSKGNVQDVQDEDDATENDQGDHSPHQKISEGAVDIVFSLVRNDQLYVSVDDNSTWIFRNHKLLSLDAKNKELCEDIQLDVYNATGKACSLASMATGVSLLSATARRTGEPIDLCNRIGKKNGKFYYDMADGTADSDSTAVEIRPGGWDIVKSPVMWRQMKHRNKQVTPSRNGDAWLFKKYFNFKEDQQLLFLVTLATCFIPDIGHPALHISGSQGAGKSFFSTLVKLLIDPSSVLLSMMPRKPEDFDLLLWRHKVAVLDNLSSLSFDVCDRLCSLISGGTIEKRSMYTDFDVTVLKNNPIIIYSSIGSLHSRPDLTERTIVFDLQRIKDTERKTEAELLRLFNADLPIILGGCFDLLAGAMQRLPHIKLASVPRMAEYCLWGYAVAEEIGPGLGEQFLAEYVGNSSIQSEELIERDTLFAAIVEVMCQPGRQTLSGSFHEVLMVFCEAAAPGEAKNGYAALQKDKTFPSSRGFRKHLERIRIPLESMNIGFKIDTVRTSQAKAFVTFTKIEAEIEEAAKAATEAVPF